MPLEVRFACLNDLLDIVDLHINTWKESYKDYIDEDSIQKMTQVSQERLMNMSSKIDKNLVYIAELDNKIVGFATLANEIQNHCTEIKQLYVAPSHQRLGIGQKLLKHIFSDLQSKGCQKVVLWTLKNYEKSNSFYHKNGGQLTGLEKRLKINVDTVQFLFHLREKE